jgi:translation initiation factor IF-3
MRSAQWSTIFSKCENTEFMWIAGFKNSYLFLLHLEVQVISDLMINEQIRDREVRVIGPDGEQLGIMSAKEAYLKAKDADLDLVKIAPTAKPPVCKIINYGKFRYDQARKEKEAKKKQRTIDVKEIRLSPNIDTNDLNTKANQARKFLSKGDKVKVTLRFRGREMAHKDVGREVLNAFYEKLEDVAAIDKEAKMEGRSMIMFLTATK